MGRMNCKFYCRCAWHALVAGLILFVASRATHAAERTPDAAGINEFVESQMRASRLPAVAVAIVRPEGEIFASTFSRNGANLTADTPFLIGSATKTITALAIAQLADAGALQFDDLVVEHLPDFALNTPDNGRTITLRHLLTHTSGLRQWSGHDSRAQREGTFNHITPARPPGSDFEYSSLNYIILGKVIEVVSGISYAEYVRVNIFEPLDMQNSFTELDSANENGLIRGHRYLYGLTVPGQEAQQPEPLVPAGFLISSARDLGNYLNMLLNEGRFQGVQIVSSETLREMFTPWDGGTTGPGMAWGIGSTHIGHAGSTPTFSARLSLLPEEQYGIVVLTNVNSGPFFPGAAAVMNGVSQIVRGEQAAPVRPDEILLKLGILILVVASVIRAALGFRHWSLRGFPHRLIASRRVLMPLVGEAVATAIMLLALPRWIGIPLLTMLNYFPDLGIAIVVGVITGVSGALMRSLVVADETDEIAVTRSTG